MATELTLNEKILLIFEKYDVFDCYSLSYGHQTYKYEVRVLTKKIDKTSSLSQVKQAITDIFNEVLKSVKDFELISQKDFKFIPDDFIEISKDIHDIYQDNPVVYKNDEFDRMKCDDLCFGILALLDELDRDLEEYQNSLDLGDGFDLECLSYQELDYLFNKLQAEVEKADKIE